MRGPLTARGAYARLPFAARGGRDERVAVGLMHGLPPEALVEKHLWIVDRFTATYKKHAPHADLRAAGALGLCEAARRFRPRKGAAFSTYAWNWVKGHVLSELRRAHVVPVPEHMARAANKRGESVHGVVVFRPDGIVRDSGGSVDDPDEQEKAADRGMRLRAMHEAVEALPREQRHVINRTLAGRTVEQIALGLGIAEEHVEELLTQARGELEWMLNG
jgi:RNA polymerase sigma factor (sigma-70 family)